jgi:hypothetical protein
MRLDAETDELTRLLTRKDPRLGWMYRDTTQEGARSARRAAVEAACLILVSVPLAFVPRSDLSIFAGEPFGAFLVRFQIAIFGMGALLMSFGAGVLIAQARYTKLVVAIKDVLAANEPPRPALRWIVLNRAES